MVFSGVGDLQVIHPPRKERKIFPPRQGHAVGNLGDAIEFFRGNILPSLLRRGALFTPAPADIRLSIIHFLRPSERTKFVSPG
ncbi:hypothetical protein BDW42DRAFT_174677 [Aspergillus taichungensis]|uniref:Uncharacterized protein n=1 Tax=Aspergillus taichungensis TaxID=482145 RepID=A0A2J5HMU7_9EURO|nr:hypothetical protein BDW42DRAFT_174677 [Aspergillus taichungensis]